MSRLQPPADPCPQAAPLLQRHALPIRGDPAPGQFDGRLEYATLVNGRTRILPTWLLTTSYRHVANRIAILLGGELSTDGDGLGQSYQVCTGHTELDVLLDGTQAIRLRMLRRHGSAILGSCNGRTQQTPDGDPPCQCPVALNARRDVAKTGRGCEPSVQLTCRLTGDPAIGTFLYSSAAWAFAEHASAVRVAIQRCRRPVLVRLGINRALHTAASGTTFAYTQATVTVLCSASSYWSPSPGT